MDTFSRHISPEMEKAVRDTLEENVKRAKSDLQGLTAYLKPRLAYLDPASMEAATPGARRHGESPDHRSASWRVRHVGKGESPPEALAI